MQDKKSIMCVNVSIPLELFEEAGVDPDGLIEISVTNGKIIISVPNMTENFACDRDCECCPIERTRCTRSRKKNARCRQK